MIERKAYLLIFLLVGLAFGQVNAQVMKNKVIAHRGAWKEGSLPENSIASLRAAIDLNCGGTEFDVWMTRDNELVVNHDPDFKGRAIEESDFSELLELQHANGESLPTLQAYLLEGQKQLAEKPAAEATRLVLEIKTSQKGKARTLELAAACVELVQRLGAAAIVDYICFDYDAGLKVIELDPQAKVSFLSASAETRPEQLEGDGFSGFDYHIGVLKSHPEFVQQARALGLTSNVWTVNSMEDMDEMLALDIDFITTDVPALLLTKLK